MPNGVLPYVLCALLFAVGLYAVAVKKNIIKIIIGVVIMDHAVNIFLVLIGYRVPAMGEAIAPIITPAMLQGGAVGSVGGAGAAMNPMAGQGAAVAAREAPSAVQQLLLFGVDPVPQALVLTSIVIGLAVVALMVVMAVRLHEKYGTFDMTHITRLKG